MKIRTNLTRNFLKIYSEAKGVARAKKYILKSGSSNSVNYIASLVLEFLIVLCIGYCLLLSSNICISVLGCLVVISDCLFILVKLFSIICIYEYRYNTYFSDSLTINEEGISNESYYDIKMTFKWSKILAIVYKKNCIVILTDTPVYFYISRNEEKKLLKAIDRYHKNVRIISR